MLVQQGKCVGKSLLEGKGESLLQLVLDVAGTTLESFVAILVVDGSVVLACNAAALEDHGDQRLQLGVCVLRIVHVVGSLRVEVSYLTSQ
jgi:hypothetical protein